MSRIGCKSYRIKSIGLALAFFLSAPLFAGDLGSLPFDHRRLLLIQMDKTEIPKSLVLTQILDEMRTRGRYQWVLASKPGEPVLPVTVPRDFSWDSPPSVQKMAEKYGVDGLLWIQQRDQEILLKWYDGTGGLPLVFDSTFLTSDANASTRIHSWMDSIWGKFPGVGFVAKRDSKFLYFEGAAENQLKPGTMVSILRVESVTRHKLFKTLAEFKASPVGKARVISVEKVLAKAEVVEESSLDPIKMGDRYQVAPVSTVAAEPVAPIVDAKPVAVATSDEKPADQNESSSNLGTVGLMAAYGQTQHSEKTVDGVDPSLKRNAPAFEVNAMAYVTSQWLAWLDYRYRFSTFVNPGSHFNNLGYLNARVNSFSILGGYRFFMGNLMGALSPAENRDFWLAPFVGYRRYTFTAKDQTLNYGPTSKTWNSMALGFQLRFPFSEKWHVRMVASKSIFVAFSEGTDLSGGNPSPSASEFAGSLYMNVSKDSAVGAGFRYQTLAVRYDGTGTRAVAATSATVKVSELTLNYETSF